MRSPVARPLNVLVVGPCDSKRIPKADLVIGVDGGIRVLQARGTRPDLIVGDWDSADPGSVRRFRATPGVQVIDLPRKKAFSDLHYALTAIPNGANVTLLGFTGGRPDHHLSNLFEIARFAVRFKKIAAIGPEAEYHFITDQMDLDQAAGTVVSVFALGALSKGVTMTGFEYNLRNEKLAPSSRGLSNVVRRRGARVQVRQGVLLLVIPRGGSC